MKKAIDAIPHKPGCYLFKDGGGGIIYVGKAKDLQKRIAAYYRNGLDPKTESLKGNIRSVDYIITGNEKEALILENNLIKKHQPKYNIDLKDSRRYAYIMLTKEEFPRLLVARQKKGEGRFFGPFTSAHERDVLLRLAGNLFSLRTCRRPPKRPCIRHEMGYCSAPCTGTVPPEEYKRQVADAVKLLSGRDAELLSDLEKRMEKASDKKDYETAKTLRDRIRAVRSLGEKQNVETGRNFNQDIVNYLVKDSMVHLAVYSAKKGVLSEKDEFEFPYTEDFLEEFITRYYEKRKDPPREIILPERLSDAVEEYLSEKRSSKIKLTVPKKGGKKDLLDLVKKNVERYFIENELSVLDLKEKLGLERTPKAIECFDISHLSGTDSAGSMIRFLDGKPDKTNYRRFRIKTVEGTDDPAMIAEIVRRRYSRILNERRELPDLVVVDGGATQVSAARKELEKLGLAVPVIGLAKKREDVYVPDLKEPVGLDRKSRALKLLQNLRDEAHRFGLKYHKVLRKKRIIGGS
ncbi:MAG: excinuclease ABC subunit C [Candidatus Altiarchaeota archaeon]|nr:excinuclease ABC subunit C [Candidatus Altiarchaeota archaeon]